MVKKDYNEERKAVSRLIYLVLADKLIVRRALLSFPKDVNDPSIKAAYHALVHREADDELRYTDIDYREEQDDYLEFIAQTFQSGSALPQNMIKSYKQYYKDANIPHSKTFRGLIKSLLRFINV